MGYQSINQSSTTCTDPGIKQIKFKYRLGLANQKDQREEIEP